MSTRFSRCGKEGKVNVVPCTRRGCNCDPAVVFQRPRWAKWAVIAEVRVHEAVALSLDRAPMEHTDYAEKTEIDFFFSGGCEEFEDRFFRLSRSLNAEFAKVERSPGRERDRAMWRVSLVEFATWARGASWVIPGELAKIATVHSVRGNDSILNNIEVAYHALEAATGKTPSQRSVAARSGYDRETVRRRWSLIQKGRPAKPNQFSPKPAKKAGQ